VLDSELWNAICFRLSITKLVTTCITVRFLSFTDEKSKRRKNSRRVMHVLYSFCYMFVRITWACESCDIMELRNHFILSNGHVQHRSWTWIELPQTHPVMSLSHSSRAKHYSQWLGSMTLFATAFNFTTLHLLTGFIWYFYDLSLCPIIMYILQCRHKAVELW